MVWISNLYICYCRYVQKRILDLLPSIIYDDLTCLDQILNKCSWWKKLCKSDSKFGIFPKDHKDHTDYPARIWRNNPGYLFGYNQDCSIKRKTPRYCDKIKKWSEGVHQQYCYNLERGINLYRNHSFSMYAKYFRNLAFLWT